MASRDSEIRDVIARLDDLLDDLAANVEALTAILDPDGTAPPPEPEEAAAP